MEIEIVENVKIYEEVIESLCRLYVDMGIQDKPVLIYETFRYMVINGYLSKDNYYNKIPHFIEILEKNNFIPFDIEGFILFLNYGVCRHTSDFLSHIYSHFPYETTQLFTYSPNVDIKLEDISSDLDNNYDIQLYIDDAMKEIDLLSESSQHLVKQYEKIRILVDYTPTKFRTNHTMNIVKKNNEQIIHILDTYSYSVGEKKMI